MGTLRCDLCGKARGQIDKRGALSLCVSCATVFGTASTPRPASDIDSLAAVAVAERQGDSARPSERSTLSIERRECSANPTLRVPLPHLDAIVRSLEGQFTPPAMPVMPAPQEHVAFLAALSHASKEAPKRTKTLPWGRIGLAWVGSLALVILLFASSAARVNGPRAGRAAGAGQPPPTVPVAALPLPVSIEPALASASKSDLPAARPEPHHPPEPKAATHSARPAPARSVHSPVVPHGEDANPAAAWADPKEINTHDGGAAPGIPEFGGRE
jgi:hypothetical protein